MRSKIAAGDTKERIIDVALELFAQSGYLGTSMSDIAKQLGITKGALYKHYTGKQEILDSIVERMNKMDNAAGWFCRGLYEYPDSNLLQKSNPATERQEYLHEKSCRRKAMGIVPGMRSENTLAALAGNRTDSISAVLPQMQARKHHQCQTLYHGNQAARR